MSLSTRKSNLLPKHSGIKVGNIPWIASKWPERIQGQCDGYRDVDWPWVLQERWRLGAWSRLTTCHCALWRGGIVQAVLKSLIFRDAQVKLIETQKEGVPILCHLRWFDLLNLKKVSNSEEGDGHSTDTDHKNDQWRTAAYVGLQILQWIQQQHHFASASAHESCGRLTLTVSRLTGPRGKHTADGGTGDHGTPSHYSQLHCIL